MNINNLHVGQALAINTHMKVQRIHKTRKSAASYLSKRGWVRAGESLGDWLFTHPTLRRCNIIIHHFDGTWGIEDWNKPTGL